MNKDNKLNNDDLFNVAGGKNYSDVSYGKQAIKAGLELLTILIKEIKNGKPTEQQKVTLKDYKEGFENILLKYGSDKYIKDACTDALNSITHYLKM